MESLPSVIEAGQPVAPIVPRTINEVEQFSDKLIEAGMVPAGLAGRTDKETRAKVTLAVVKGLEVGFPPLTAVANIMVVNNRASVWGDALPALVQRTGKLVYMKEWFSGEPGNDNRTALCELGREGVETRTVRAFSLSDAKRARLYPDPKRQPWLLYTDRMLQMRARAWAFRDLFADCLMGLSVAEEAQDLPMRDVTPNPGAALDDDPVTVTETEVMPSESGEPVRPDDATTPPQVVGARPVIEDDQDRWVFELAEKEALKGMAALEAWFVMQPKDTKAAVKPYLDWLKGQAARVDNGEIIEAEDAPPAS